MPKKPNKYVADNEIIEEEVELDVEEMNEGGENSSEPGEGYQNEEGEYNYDNVDIQGRLVDIIVDERVARRLHEEGIEEADPQYAKLKEDYEKEYTRISDNGGDKLVNAVMAFQRDDIILFCDKMEEFSGREKGNYKFLDDVDALASMSENNMIDEVTKVDKAFGDMFSPKRYNMLNLKLVGVRASGEFEDPDFKAAEDLNREINLAQFFDEEKDPPEREMMIESLVAGCLLREDVLGELAPRTFSSLESIKGAELAPKGETNLEKMLDPLFNNTIGEDNRRNANMPRLAVPKARKMAETILLGLEKGSEEGKIAVVEALENVVRVAGKYAQNCTENDHRLFASSKLVYGAMQLLEQPAYRTYSTLSKKEIELARSVCAGYECQKGMIECHNEVQADLMLKYAENDGRFNISVIEDNISKNKTIVETNESKIQKLNSYRHILEGQVQYSRNHSGKDRRITDNEYLCALDSEEYSNLLSEKQEVKDNVKSVFNATDVQSFVNGYKEYFNKKYPKVDTIHYDSASFNKRFNRACNMMNIVMTQVDDISPISDYYSELTKLNETVAKINKSDYEKIETLTKQRSMLAHFANRVTVNAKGDSYTSRFVQDLLKAHVVRATNAGQIKDKKRPKDYVYSTSDLPRFLWQDVEREINIAREFANEASILISELDQIIKVREDEKKVVNNVIVRDKLTKHITSSGSTGIDKMRNFAAKSGMNLSRSTLELREKVFVKNKVKSKFAENHDIINTQLREDFGTASVHSAATSKISRVSGVSSISRMSTMSKMEADYKNANDFYKSKENIQKAMEYNPEMNKGKFYVANTGSLKTVTLPEISKIKSLDKVNKKPNLDWGGKYSMLEPRQSVLDKISTQKDVKEITPPEFRVSQADISVLENQVRNHFYNSDLKKAREAYKEQINDLNQNYSSDPSDNVTGKLTKYIMADINYAIELNKAVSATGKGNIDFIIQDSAAAIEKLEKCLSNMEVPLKPGDKISQKNQDEFIKFVRKDNGPSDELVSLILLQNLNKKREEYQKSKTYDNSNPNGWVEDIKIDEETADAYNKAKEMALYPDYEAFHEIFEPQDLIKQKRLESKRSELESKLKKYQKLFEDTAGLFPKEQIEVANKARNACVKKSRDLHFGNTSQKEKIFFTRTVTRIDETGTSYKVQEKHVNGDFVNIISTLEMYKKQLKSKVLDDSLWKKNYAEKNYNETRESLLERYEQSFWDQDDEEMAYDFMLEKFDLNMDEVSKYLNENVNGKGEPVPKTNSPKDQTRFELLKAQRKNINNTLAKKRFEEARNAFEQREKTNNDNLHKRLLDNVAKIIQARKEEEARKRREEEQRIAREQARIEAERVREEQERIAQEEQLRKAQEDKKAWDKEREKDVDKYFTKEPAEKEQAAEKQENPNAEEVAENQENLDLNNEAYEEDLDDILMQSGLQSVQEADVEISDTSTEIRKNLAPELAYLQGKKFESPSLKGIVSKLDFLNLVTEKIYNSTDKKTQLDKETITEFAALNEDTLKEIETFLNKSDYTKEEAPEIDRMIRIMSYLKSDIELINQFEINDVKNFTIDELVEDARERNEFALDTKDAELKAVEKEGSMQIPISYIDEHHTVQEGYIFPIAGNMNPQNANKRIFNDNLFFYKMGASEGQKDNVNAVLDSGYQAFADIFDEDGDVIEKKAAGVLKAKGIKVDDDFDWKKFSADVRKIKSDIEYQAELSTQYYDESRNVLSRGRNLAYNTIARGFGVGGNVPVSRILKIKNGSEEINVGFEHRLYKGAHYDLSSEVTSKWAASGTPKVTKTFLLKAIDMDAYNYIVGFKPDYSNMRYKFIREKDDTPHLDGIMMQKTDGSFATDINKDDFKKMPYITSGMAEIIKKYNPERLRRELKSFGLGDKEITGAVERLNTAKQVVDNAEKGIEGGPTIITRENVDTLNISDPELTAKSGVLKEIIKTCNPAFVKEHAKKADDKTEFTQLSETKEVWFSKKDTYLNPLESLKCELDKSDSFFHINSGLYKKMYGSLESVIRSMGVSSSPKEASFKSQYKDLLTKCGNYVKDRGKNPPSSKIGKDRLAAAIKIGKFVERRLEIVNLKEARTALAEKFIVISNKGKSVTDSDYAAVGGSKFDRKVTQVLLNPAFDEMVRGKTSKELKDMFKMEDNKLVSMLKDANKRVDVREQEKKKEVKTLKSIQNGITK